MPDGLQLVVLAALASAAALPAVAAERTFEKTFPVSPGGTLRLSTDVGSVQVTGGPGTDVTLKVRIRGSQRFVDGFEVSAERQDADVHVRGKAPTPTWRLFGNANQDATFVVTVPARCNVEASTAGGDVVISAIEGKVTGQTSGGDIEASEVVGDVALRTSGGDVEVRQVTGAVDAQTSGGDVEVTAVTGDVKASTSGGDVTIDDARGAVHATTSGGDVQVTLRGENRGIRAETSGGDVEIAVAPDVGAEIDAGTSGGEVRCGLPVTVQGAVRESSVKGTLNGGGPLIYAHTLGGDVRLREAAAGRTR